MHERLGNQKRFTELPVVAQDFTARGGHGVPPGLACDARIDIADATIGETDLDAARPVSGGQTKVTGRSGALPGRRHLELGGGTGNEARRGGTVTPVVDDRHPLIPRAGIGIRSDVVKRATVGRAIRAGVGFAHRDAGSVQNGVRGAVRDVENAAEVVDFERGRIDEAAHRFVVADITRHAVNAPAGVVVGSVAVGRVRGVDENLGRRLIVGDGVIVAAGTASVVDQTAEVVLLDIRQDLGQPRTIAIASGGAKFDEGRRHVVHGIIVAVRG